MTDKKAYADALMDAVGRIDDDLITEAASYKRKTPGYLKAAIGMAASFLILFTVMIPVLVRTLPRGSQSAAPSGLLDVLSSAGSATVSSVEPVGQPRIIWQVDGEDVYHVINVSGSVASALSAQSGKGTRSDGGEEYGFRLWVTDGSGRFVTPQLSASDGNVGCTVFDYGEEYEFSPQAERIIKEAVKTAKG